MRVHYPCIHKRREDAHTPTYIHTQKQQVTGDEVLAFSSRYSQARPTIASHKPLLGQPQQKQLIGANRDQQQLAIRHENLDSGREVPAEIVDERSLAAYRTGINPPRIHEVGGERERKERYLARMKAKSGEIDYWKDPFAGEYGGELLKNKLKEEDERRDVITR